MMTEAEAANPFRTWAELARGLRDRFVEELGGKSVSPYTGEVMGQMAALITQCEHLGTALHRLSQKEESSFDAFVRALERS